MKNLTPHPISLQLPSGERTTFPPSGQLARVTTEEVVTGEFAGVPVIRRQFGAVTGLPEDGEACIVSAMVLSAIPAGTPGVYAPDTGPTAVRDDAGRIVAVTRLVAA